MGREAARRRMRNGLASVVATLVVLAVAGPVVAAPFLPPFRPKNQAAYERAKQRASEETSPLGSPLSVLTAPAATGPKARIVANLNRPGLSHSDNSAFNDGTPPDPTGAIGPSDYIEFVNSVVRRYDRDLTTFSNPADTQQLDTFVGQTNDAVFDPQIEYDPVADRWFYLADDCASNALDCTGQTFLAFGFSKSGNPANMTTDWCNYRIRTDNAGGTGLFDDYPKLGHNDTHIIFGTNVFNSLGNFVSARIWTVPKPAAGTLATCPTSASIAGNAHWFSGTAASPSEDQTLLTHPLLTSAGAAAFTPVPANTQDSSANGYVVAAGDPPGSTIMAWHVKADGTLAADGNITVNSFSMPSNVPQPGTTDVLDSSDTRLTQAVAHADPDAAGAEAIWTQHTIDGPGGRSVDRWYELLPASKTARQQGDITDPNNYVFNGAISPTLAGNEAAIEYNVGGTGQLAQIKAQSRTSTRALGAMGGEVLIGTSTHFDQDFSCPSQDPTALSCRWGDYAAATPDPDTVSASSAHTVWGTNQLLGDPDSTTPDEPHWITRNFALLVDEGPVASFTASPNPQFTKKPVTFDATASHDPDGGNLSFEWDFGDGNFVPGGAVVTHSYPTVGTFTVRARVSDDNGGSPDVTSHTETVVSGAPVAAFSVSPLTAGRGTPVNFDGSASHDVEGPGGIASYNWDFDGDGTVDQTTSGPTVQHSYSSLGSFTPKLSVVDADDGDTSATATGARVTISGSAPAALLSFSPATPVAGSPVVLDGSASSDADGPLMDYRWDLDGDGNFETDTGTTPTISKTFNRAGNFPVALLVQDSSGNTATARATVPVSAKFKLVLKFPKKVKLARLLKTGLAGTVTCGRGCTTKLTLKLSKKLARTLRTKTIVARKTVAVGGGRSAQARLRLTKAAKKALKKIRTLSTTLIGTAVDSAGHSSTAKLTIKIRR